MLPSGLMVSDMSLYVHSNYAGNLADCHKHQWLCFLLEQLQPASYLETHAGGGCYSLTAGGRWQQGIGQLWPLRNPGLSDHWPSALQQLNPETLETYPGSPWLAQQILGAEPLLLFELEMDTADRLRDVLPDADVRTGDGFSSVVHLIDNGCFLMVDPPYNDLYDFDRAMMLLNLVIQRQDCTMMLWYPRFNDEREQPYLQQMEALLAERGALSVWRNELTFAEPQGSLRGSGVLVTGATAPNSAQLQVLSEQLAHLQAGIETICY